MWVEDYSLLTFAAVMTEVEKIRRSKPVATWIMIGVGMLLIQVVLGGITRLTGSGLSITEWNVVTGTLPPLNQQQWINEFQKYQQTPQYKLLNTDFTLSDFKFIFFWEWLHRLWARLIAVAFLIPFIIFLLQRRIKREMVPPLVFLFLFGAFQGAIGWIMVMSGLTGDAVYVKPTKLALHFVSALGLIAYAFWVGLRWLYPSERINALKLKPLTVSIIVIIFIQLVFGALMAGHKGAVAAPTWPTINGSLVPDGLFREEPTILNLVDNIITIHFIHRGFAYLLLVLIVIWTVKALKIRQADPIFLQSRIFPAIIVGLQVGLGVLAVLSSLTIVPNQWGGFEWLALLHQVVGMLLLLSMVGMLYFLGRKYQTQRP
jgi:heme a synthase